MQRDEVRTATERFKIDNFHARFARLLRLHEWIAGEQPQAPAAELARHRSANVPQPDNSNGLARHAVDRLVPVHIPTPLFDTLVYADNVPRACEQERNRVR